MRLLETIHIRDGQALHLEYHQKRLEFSRDILGLNSELYLELDPPQQGEFRCRVVYEEKIEKIEYIPYQHKEIKSFKVLHSDVHYPLKYEDRSAINDLLKRKENADDIIIIKEGLVCDTSIANLCFFDGDRWLTPEIPLLKGTTRQRLLEQEKIFTSSIRCEDITKYSKIAVMNAMTDFCIIENAIIL